MSEKVINTRSYLSENVQLELLTNEVAVPQLAWMLLMSLRFINLLFLWLSCAVFLRTHTNTHPVTHLVLLSVNVFMCACAWVMRLVANCRQIALPHTIIPVFFLCLISPVDYRRSLAPPFLFLRRRDNSSVFAHSLCCAYIMSLLGRTEGWMDRLTRVLIEALTRSVTKNYKIISSQMRGTAFFFA